MKNIGIKTWGCLTVILLSTLSVQAQQNELGISLYGGLGKVKFENSDIMNGHNGGLSLDYHFRIDENWGIVTGLSYGRYQLKIEQKDYMDAYMTKDAEGEEMEFRTKMGSFTETLKGNYFAIPLALRYETSRLSATNFYIQGGFQYRINSKLTSDLTIAQLQTSGYFPGLDAELFAPEFMGFGQFDYKSEERELELKNSFSLLGEVGVKQAIGDNQVLYLGLYVDFDLSNEPQDRVPTVDYQAVGPTRLDFNSRLEQKNEDRAQLRMLAVGLKLRYAFGI